MPAYYNENDPFAAAWLRELIAKGLIADGEVDTRSIVDVRSDDLQGFTQCHFFAGIGGWSCALRLAGWTDEREVCTLSCPCQPLSAAGRGMGASDPRHLWPQGFRLITERRFTTIFGEQVASADGRAWFDLVSADLESCDYAIGSADLPACGVGAPNKRQRLWFVADAGGDRYERIPREGRQAGDFASGVRARLGDSERRRCKGGYADWQGANQPGATCGINPPWDHYDLVACGDGAMRPIEPGLKPLAYGIPARVGRLRGYGNAINPYVAAEVIRAYMDVTSSGGVEAAPSVTAAVQNGQTQNEQEFGSGQVTE